MFATCPFCGSIVTSHGPCCRVPAELDRFERVFERLSTRRHHDSLESRLAYYLHEFGRRATVPAGG
jgi:hypothetical protein